jgi:simple sugar transport system substrate-binding protein
MTMDRRTFNKLLGAGVLAGSAPAIIGRAAAAEPVKAAWIYVGPVGDYGYSYQHDQGRKLVEEKLGNKVKTTFVENVPEGADTERVLVELANKGNNIIFATSFGFMNPTVAAAKRFPNVKFEHATGYKRAKNLATYNIRFYEGRYVQGVIAGHLSKSGIIGYVGAVPIPEVIMGVNAFLLGARSVNPKIRSKFILINTWYDPGKEGDAAKAMIDQGADIITQHTDSPAAMQAAANRGVKAFGQATDMIKFAPKDQLTASIDNWGPYYVQRVQEVIDGTWKSTDVWGGFKAGMLEMAPFRNMPDDVAKAAQATVDGIASGKILPFKGPLKDQSGKVRVPAGKDMPDSEIASMNWLVEGVEGKLPS